MTQEEPIPCLIVEDRVDLGFTCELVHTLDEAVQIVSDHERLEAYKVLFLDGNYSSASYGCTDGITVANRAKETNPSVITVGMSGGPGMGGFVDIESGKSAVVLDKEARGRLVEELKDRLRALEE